MEEADIQKVDIQVGDRITYKYEDENKHRIVIISNLDELGDYKNMATTSGEFSSIRIIKIERPKYEVVEEKKELLTEEEKEFLRQAFKFGNYGSNTGNETVKFVCKSGYYICIYYDEWASNTIYIDKNLYFKGLEEDEKYTLKELGLEVINGG